MLHVAFTPTNEPIQFTGAKAASGWVLAWTDEYQFYSWSPSSGWHALPERNYTSYVAGVTVIPLEDGLLVYPDVLHFGTSTNEVGFWVYGAERWAWWESIPEFDSIHAVGNNRVLLWEERIIAADVFWVFACSKDGIERRALLRSEKMDGMYAARGCENDGSGPDRL